MRQILFRLEGNDEGYDQIVIIDMQFSYAWCFLVRSSALFLMLLNECGHLSIKVFTNDHNVQASPLARDPDLP